MPDLSFQVESAQAVKHAASPLLHFKLNIDNRTSDPVHTIVLNCQIRIDPLQRTYAENEQNGLRDLFGERSRWGQTLKPMLWTHASVIVPAFKESTTANLPVPCTYDFNIAATKYFHALQDGEIPLTLLFSGSIFYDPGEGHLQVAQIPWEKEARFRLPVKIWREMMDIYYPNTAWLCLHKDAFDHLHRYKSENTLPTWERAIEKLLAQAEITK
ncbi:MAG TPA: DUF6084 family protein [Tepidisphaeraceae bacterium]|jgi:hypothetical protein